MRLGGWTRIWIVLSGLLAIGAGVIAYGTMPSRQSVLADWYSDATEVISARIPGPDGQPISSYEVHDSFFSGTEKENLEFLRVLAEGRTDNIKLSAVEIRAINSEHEAELAHLRLSQAAHWALVFGWWAAIVLGIYLAGWTLRWIYRGFRTSTA